LATMVQQRAQQLRLAGAATTAAVLRPRSIVSLTTVFRAMDRQLRRRRRHQHHRPGGCNLQSREQDGMAGLGFVDKSKLN
jgi:hypothetical protein